MTEISASLVKELRDQTGAGMMDCKRALEETAGDLESARVLLRERGMASAGKRAGRATTEGLVGFIIDGNTGSILGIGCETEPVSKNDAFRSFAARSRGGSNWNNSPVALCSRAVNVRALVPLMGNW